MAEKAGQAMAEWHRCPRGRLMEWADRIDPKDLRHWLNLYDQTVGNRYDLSVLSEQFLASLSVCKDVAHWRRFRNRLEQLGYLVMTERGLTIPQADYEWQQRDALSTRKSIAAKAGRDARSTSADDVATTRSAIRDTAAATSEPKIPYKNQSDTSARAQRQLHDRTGEDMTILSPSPLGAGPLPLSSVMERFCDCGGAEPSARPIAEEASSGLEPDRTLRPVSASASLRCSALARGRP